jgi:hypothetical protein
MPSASFLDIFVNIPLVGLGGGMAGALVGAFFGVMTPVNVNHQDIRVGPSERGFMWWDEMSGAKKVRSLGVPYLRLISATGRVLDVPVHLRHGERFIAAVLEHSLEDNPLRKELTTELKGG